MSYSVLQHPPLGSIDEGCPGQWYLIDKNDKPSCADSCPSGWVQQIDEDMDVKWCKQPADAADLPTLEEASQAYEADQASQAGMSVGTITIVAAAVVLGVTGLYVATR